MKAAIDIRKNRTQIKNDKMLNRKPRKKPERIDYSDEFLSEYFGGFLNSDCSYRSYAVSKGYSSKPYVLLNKLKETNEELYFEVKIHNSGYGGRKLKTDGGLYDKRISEMSIIRKYNIKFGELVNKKVSRSYLLNWFLDSNYAIKYRDITCGELMLVAKHHNIKVINDIYRIDEIAKGMCM